MEEERKEEESVSNFEMSLRESLNKLKKTLEFNSELEQVAVGLLTSFINTLSEVADINKIADDDSSNSRLTTKVKDL